MHLSYIAENLVLNTLNAHSESCNILYEPHSSILDTTITSAVQGVFYTITDNQQLKVENQWFAIPARLATMYNYNLFMNFSLEQYVNTNHISFIYHIPSIVFIDKAYEYKKEDRYLINEKTKHITKIFLSEHAYDSLGKPPKSFVIDMGMPVNKQDIAPKKNIAIINNSMVAKQIHHILSSNTALACDLIDTSSIGLIKNYKFCIDISANYRYNLLYALSVGCIPITLKQNPTFTSYMHHVNTPEEIIDIVNNTTNTTIDINHVNEYLTINHNYDKFTELLNQIVHNVKKEVYIK